MDAVLAALGTDAAEVVGAGALADALRARLPAPAAPPAAIVDTTGDPAAIADALARVDDLGTVVLAGPVPEGTVALDLYADVHVRGLTVVGVAPDGDGGAPAGVEPGRTPADEKGG
jgi:threonine dehydrogenase-like Zn-dependent dehydrogenase